MKINFYGIKKFLKGKNLLRIAENTVQHLLLSSLIFFLFSLILGGFLFFIYVFLPQKTEPEALQKHSLLKEDIYKEVLKIWQEEKTKFDETSTKEYLDPFRKIIQVPEKSGSRNLTE